MRKIVVILSVLVLLFAFVSCKESVDRLFGFDLTLEANDGTGTKTTVRINGADGKVPECPFSREGYTFYKWNTKQDGSGTSYEEGDAVPQDKDHTLYAQWSFDLTLEANDGTGTKTTVRINGTGGKIPECPFSREKYSFAGWNTKQDGSGTSYEEGDAVPQDKDHTLYAQWEIIPIILEDSTKIWTDGNVYLLNSDVHYTEDRIYVSGSVTLILNDGYTLTADMGINVYEGYSLTIGATGEGTGRIVATGPAGRAGIGGSNINHNCGVITINGGTVNASASGGGAGIGGGSDGSGGTITINGGTVYASADCGGAGIGGGSDGSGGTVIINGGTVYANAVNGGAGIGKGYNGDSDGTLTLGTSVALEVSSNGTDWYGYDGSTRKEYMRTI